MRTPFRTQIFDEKKIYFSQTFLLVMGVLTLSVCDEGSMTVGRAVSTFEVLAGLVEVVDVWTC